MYGFCIPTPYYPVDMRRGLWIESGERLEKTLKMVLFSSNEELVNHICSLFPDWSIHPYDYVPQSGLENLIYEAQLIIADSGLFNVSDPVLNQSLEASQVPVVLILKSGEDSVLLEKINENPNIEDYIFDTQIGKLSFIINRLLRYQGKGKFLASEDPHQILNGHRELWNFKINQLIEKNLELLEQLAETQKALKQVSNEEKNYRSMVEQSGDVVYSTDFNGYFTYINPSLKKLTGYSPKELKGKFYLDLIHPDYKKELFNFYQKQFHERIPETINSFPIVTKEGKKKWVEQTVTLLSEGNWVKGFQCIVRDITERKNFEKKLEHHTKMLERSNKELELFAYIASHDLQEPLRKINAFASRLSALREVNLGEKGADYMNRLTDAARRMEVLINDLLKYSRIFSYRKHEFAPTDLNLILEGVLTEMKDLIQETGTKIKSELLPVAEVIPAQISQLIQNIISNSIKYCKSGEPPQIEIRSGIVKETEIPDIRNSDPDRLYSAVSFEDKGIGFENEYSEKIFQVFKRLHPRSSYKGTGIGLAIVKKIVDTHNGFIKASGRPGEGARFTIYLPLNQVESD